MAKPTLLEIVQGILSDADGDEVNSISDTVESYQCARIVKECYLNIVDAHDLSYQEGTYRLDATSTATPSQMTRPAGLYHIDWVMYDKKLLGATADDYQKVHWLEPEAFILMCQSRTEGDSNVEVLTLDSGHGLLIRNDVHPTYFTQLQGYDDILFDSYLATVDDNLQQSKTLVWGRMRPTMSLTDAATADLPEHLFSLLKNEARAVYFDMFKDGVTREVDRMRRRSEVRAQRHRHITNNMRPEQTGQNYGRKRR